MNNITYHQVEDIAISLPDIQGFLTATNYNRLIYNILWANGYKKSVDLSKELGISRGLLNQWIQNHKKSPYTFNVINFKKFCYVKITGLSFLFTQDNILYEQLFQRATLHDKGMLFFYNEEISKLIEYLDNLELENELNYKKEKEWLLKADNLYDKDGFIQITFNE